MHTDPLTDESRQPTAHTRTLRVGQHITLTVSRKSLILGGCIATALLLLTLLHTECYLQAASARGELLYVLSLLASVVIGIIAAVRVELPPRVDAVVNTVVVLLLPIVAMTMVECLNSNFTWNWSPRTLLVNYILYMLFYGVVYVFSGSYRLPMLIMNVLFFLFGLTNFYVRAFRGTPFIPMDLFAAGTAANVAAAYDFSFNHLVIIAILLLAFLTVVAARLRTPRLNIISKIASRTFFAVLTVCVVCIYLFTDLYAQAGLAPDFWSQKRGYNRTGALLNFCLNTKYTTSSAPSGYDADEVKTIVYTAVSDDPTDQHHERVAVRPVGTRRSANQCRIHALPQQFGGKHRARQPVRAGGRCKHQQHGI